MADILVKIGLAISILGFLIETVGMVAVGYYPIRRKLRVMPISLIAIGGYCFFGGVLLGLVARFAFR